MEDFGVRDFDLTPCSPSTFVDRFLGTEQSRESQYTVMQNKNTAPRKSSSTQTNLVNHEFIL